MAALLTPILYVNVVRVIKMPQETVNFNSNSFLSKIDSCHIKNNQVYVPWWAALRNNEVMSQIYIT